MLRKCVSTVFTESQSFKWYLHKSDLLVNGLNFCLLNTKHTREPHMKMCLEPCQLCKPWRFDLSYDCDTQDTQTQTVSLLWVQSEVLLGNPGWMKGQQHLLNTEAKGSTHRQEVSWVKAAMTEFRYNEASTMISTLVEFGWKEGTYFMELKTVNSKT